MRGVGATTSNLLSSDLIDFDLLPPKSNEATIYGAELASCTANSANLLVLRIYKISDNI